MSATEENVTIDINDTPPVEMKTESVKVEECIELKNIKAKRSENDTILFLIEPEVHLVFLVSFYPNQIRVASPSLF